MWSQALAGFQRAAQQIADAERQDAQSDSQDQSNAQEET
jgi:hypothetical protein